MKPKVLTSTSRVNPEILDLYETSLKDMADVRFSSFQMTDEFLKELRDAEALVVTLESIGEEMIKHAPKLKIVARYGVGYDNIDIEACTKREIYVSYTPGVLSKAVAELTMGLMLCLSRGLIRADKRVRTEWNKPNVAQPPFGTDLVGKTLGIIGLGRIGYEVARRAKAFEMNLVYYDQVRREDLEKELGIKYMGFDELLRDSDFVTLHIPLIPETSFLIGERELRLMKKTAYLINTSRGAVIDEKALCKALQESWIAGAGLDVFTKEPLPLESPLTKLENAVLTPHIGTYTSETRRAMALSVIENVRKVLSGKTPLTPVPEQRGKTFRK